MNFDLSDEQRLLQDTIRSFLDAECPPTRLHAIFDSEEPWDPTLWKGMAELGLCGIHIPEDFGGAGLETLDLAVAAETLGAHAAPAPFLGHALAAAAIAFAGSRAQKECWLPRLAMGEALGSVAFAEAAGCWQPEEWTLAPGERLSGRKEYVVAGREADVIVVGTAGGGLAILDPGASGVRIEAVAGVDRTRRFAKLVLDAAACEPLTGEANAGEAAARVRDLGLVLLAADAFGGASRCVEMSVEYAKTREQFGVTIGHFQALKHQLANMAVEVEPARGLYWYAAHAFDRVREESPRSAALAKAHLTDCFMNVARGTVEAHGGIGFTWESDVQIWYKRAMFDRAYLGTPPVHRERAAQLAHW